MNKIILIFVAISAIFGGIYIYTLPPKSPLPNINYIGMSRNMVIETLVNEPVLDRKTNKNLIAIPYANFFTIRDKGDIQNNSYAMQQPIWDVNFIYTKNYIRGGYYFFRLFFNKNGIVENQKVLFASDGFFWL